MIEINFDKMGGLIPAVIQEYENGEVLMVAFMAIVLAIKPHGLLGVKED